MDIFVKILFYIPIIVLSYRILKISFKISCLVLFMGSLQQIKRATLGTFGKPYRLPLFNVHNWWFWKGALWHDIIKWKASSSGKASWTIGYIFIYTYSLDSILFQCINHTNIYFNINVPRCAYNIWKNAAI